MKKAVLGILVLVMLMVNACAFCDTFDLSGLSFEELAALRDRCQMEMMKSDKWQEVTVPEGIYQIGKDIPAGHWTISAPSKGMAMIYAGRKMANDFMVDFEILFDLYGLKNGLYHEGSTTSISLDLKDGQYLQIMLGSVIFTPYQGNSFSFK